MFSLRCAKSCGSATYVPTARCGKEGSPPSPRAVRPDLFIKNRGIPRKKDTLHYALQSAHGAKIILPARRTLRAQHEDNLTPDTRDTRTNASRLAPNTSRPAPNTRPPAPRITAEYGSLRGGCSLHARCCCPDGPEPTSATASAHGWPPPRGTCRACRAP